MKRRRILAIMHADLVPPDDIGSVDPTEQEWRTEYDVLTTLRELGHDVRPLGLRDELRELRLAVQEFRPHIAFNLLEEFAGEAVFDQNVVSYLELLGVPYTGCNPRGLILTRDKALAKKILTYHRIPVPDFVVFRRGRRVRRPKKLAYPLIVKSLIEEASLGIAQASVVHDDASLVERVAFIHDSIATDAIAESFIDGREVYVGILGNERLHCLPIWELDFSNMPDESVKIATAKVKWDAAYQKRHGIQSAAAKGFDAATTTRILRRCKRAYRALALNGYGRLDLRVGADGRVYVIEANPNPQIAYGEDFAESADHAGISYGQLIQRIVNLGLRWRPTGR